MLPNHIVHSLAHDPTAMFKVLSEFHTAALNAAQEITDNNLAAFVALSGSAALKETCIRNIEVIAKLWKPYHLHPTT